MYLFKLCKCGKIIPQGVSMCTVCAQAAASRHTEYNKYKRDTESAAFYTSQAWRSSRALCMQRYAGLDVYELIINKKIIKADMVHHIEPVKEQWDKRFDQDNLIPLSNKNHNKFEALYDKSPVNKQKAQAILRRVKKMFDEQGGV